MPPYEPKPTKGECTVAASVPKASFCRKSSSVRRIVGDSQLSMAYACDFECVDCGGSGIECVSDGAVLDDLL